MASLFKPTIITYWTPDGHKCKKAEACNTNDAGKTVLRPGYRRKREKATKWYGRIRYPDGRVIKSPLATDKAAAQAMLGDLVKKVERGEADMTDPFHEHGKRPLLEHLEDFRRYLAAKGGTGNHVDMTLSRAKTVIEGCKFVRWRDVSPSAVVEYLAELRNQGLGVATSNYYMGAVKQFAHWMFKEQRVSKNPLVGLSRMNAKLDVRRERRALTPAQFAAFIKAARKGEPFRGLTGEDRETLYLLASNTGFREGELASLRPESFNLDADPPTVTVEAAYSKRRRPDTLPLRADVADMMRGYIASKPQDAPLWPSSWTEKGAVMVRLDLAAAGIPYRDEDGRVFDFHSLRHQFISNLVAAGVHPKVAQKLARHSTITLTMDRYSHTLREQETAALEKLPGLPPQRPADDAGTLRATGTDDAPVCPDPGRFVSVSESGLSPACPAGAVSGGSLRSTADDTPMSTAEKRRTKPQDAAGAESPANLKILRSPVRPRPCPLTQAISRTQVKRTCQRLTERPETQNARKSSAQERGEAAMSDQPHRVPKYRCKKSNGRKYGCVSLPDGAGGRRDILLGKFGTRASRVEYARVIAEWEAAGQQLPAPNGQAPDLTVNELVLRFWKHAEQHYRQPDGAQTRELSDYKLSARPLVHLYGLERAGAFGPLALKAVRQKMIDGYEHPKHGPQPSLARGVINQRIGRIKRIFRWGVSEQLIHESVYSALCAVDGLKKGRTAARETAPVKPVPLAFVQATLPYLLPPVRAMVELQLATGMRPGEVCAMRTIDLDTSGAVWLYRPGSDQGPEGAHKTAWRGHQRVIAIGPKGQEIIKPWLRADLNERLFQPKDAVQLRCVALRQRRQTPLQPSQVDRRKKQPKRRPGECYSVAAYGLAIRRAIVRANETAEADCKPSIPQWHSNQVRHTRATEIRKRFGLDAARAVLGHRPPVVSEIYAELDSGLATEVMAKLG